MSAVNWFHSFEFPDGEIAKGHKPLDRLKAEADVIFRVPVAGKTVLDIGAWDGFFSFEAEKRDAALVHSTDHFCWSGPGWGTKRGYDYAHAKFNSNAASTDIDVFSISQESVGSFDVVLFLGVLYHLKNPLGGLEIISSVTKEFAVIETEVDALDYAEPVMRFYQGPELNNDPTNFWAPNIPCLENMLAEVGFKRTEISSVDPMPASGRWRAVAHAWK